MKKILLSCATMLCALSMSAGDFPFTPVSVMEADIATNYLFTLSDGTTVVVWSQPNHGQQHTELMGWNNIQTFMRSYDKEGNCINPDGQPVLISGDHATKSWIEVQTRQAMVDKDDNIIVSVNDCRNVEDEPGFAPGNMGFSLYKLDKYGNMLWDEPVDLHRGLCGHDVCFDITQLADGSYVVAWCTFSDELELYGLQGPSYIMMERVSKDGKLMWDEAKYWQKEDADHMYCYLTDGLDNEFNVITLEGSGQFMTVRRYDFDGEPVWTKDCVINYGEFGSSPAWTHITVEPDGNGGTYATWHDFTFDPNFDVAKIAHIDRDGKHVYNSGIGGTRVTYLVEDDFAVRSHNPRHIADPETGVAYVLHEVFDAGQSYHGLVMQKVDARGNLLWGSEGSMFQFPEIRSVNTYCISVDNEKNPVAFYLEYYGVVVDSEDDYGLYIEKLNPEDGEPIWEERVKIPTDPNYPYMSDLRVSPMIDNSYWMVSFTAKPTPSITSSTPSLFVMQVYNDGTARVVNVVEDFDNDAPAEYFNINGMSVSGDNLTPGLYIKRQGSKTTKFFAK